MNKAREIRRVVDVARCPGFVQGPPRFRCRAEDDADQMPRRRRPKTCDSVRRHRQMELVGFDQDVEGRSGRSTTIAPGRISRAQEGLGGFIHNVEFRAQNHY